MSSLRLIISILAILATCKASGVGHLVPAVRSVPIVRYAPFYNFPNGVRSIHAVAPPVFPPPVLPPPPPAHLVPAPAPFLPGPPPFLPGPPPFLPAPAPLLPAPAPVFPAPVSVFPAPASIWPGPVVARTPVFPAPLPAPAVAAFSHSPVLPRIVPSVPALPRIIPSVPALHAPVFARALPALHAPFSPIIRPAGVYHTQAQFLPPAPIPVARAVAPYHIPSPVLPAPFLKHAAWK